MHHDDIHPILKYPRTPHLEGSRLQPGDSAADQAPLASLAGRHVVIEEKLDGANAGLSFSGAADLLLQSRGHYLTGGGRERQFNLFKQWAAAHEARLLHAPKTATSCMASGRTASIRCSTTACRTISMSSTSMTGAGRVPVDAASPRAAGRFARAVGAVLYAGPMPARPAQLRALLRWSLGKSAAWKDSLRQAVAREGLDWDLCWRQTDGADLSEGLYLKIEDDRQVLARYKFVRRDFVQTIWTAARIMRAAPSCRTGWRGRGSLCRASLRDLGIAGAAHDVRAGRVEAAARPRANERGGRAK